MRLASDGLCVLSAAARAARDENQWPIWFGSGSAIGAEDGETAIGQQKRPQGAGAAAPNTHVHQCARR